MDRWILKVTTQATYRLKHSGKSSIIAIGGIELIKEDEKWDCGRSFHWWSRESCQAVSWKVTPQTSDSTFLSPQVDLWEKQGILMTQWETWGAAWDGRDHLTAIAADEHDSGTLLFKLRTCHYGCWRLTSFANQTFVTTDYFKLLTNLFCYRVGNFIFLGCKFALSKTNGSRAWVMFSVT